MGWSGQIFCMWPNLVVCEIFRSCVGPYMRNVQDVTLACSLVCVCWERWSLWESREALLVASGMEATNVGNFQSK